MIIVLIIEKTENEIFIQDDELCGRMWKIFHT